MVELFSKMLVQSHTFTDYPHACGGTLTVTFHKIENKIYGDIYYTNSYGDIIEFIYSNGPMMAYVNRIIGYNY